MILSVSRRTDIPNYYFDWFVRRMKEGFLYVRNPMNAHQISRIDLSPEVVDCVVFWTKNPEGMLKRAEELRRYPYYVQFTLTGYGKDVEPGLPHKRRKMIPVFQTLSRKAGNDRVIWRYDPIFFNPIYTPAYHLKAFEEIAHSLAGYTHRVVISFLDLYAKIRHNMAELSAQEFPDADLLEFAQRLAAIARRYELRIESCAEAIDLSAAGIGHGSCIDGKLIEEIIGCPLLARKDKNQRKECGCVESIDVGCYNTCLNGCLYCYANEKESLVRQRAALYDPVSPLLCGTVGTLDRVSDRRVRSWKDPQLFRLPEAAE